MKYKKVGVAVIILAVTVTLISLSFSTCKSRKARAEAISFLKVFYDTSPVVASILIQIDQSDPQDPEIDKILNDLIQQINTLLLKQSSMGKKSGYTSGHRIY